VDGEVAYNLSGDDGNCTHLSTVLSGEISPSVNSKGFGNRSRGRGGIVSRLVALSQRAGHEGAQGAKS
jgi:hypothetical protein